MLQQTKLTLAVLGLSLSSAAMAGVYGGPKTSACVPGDVTVPCEAKKWDLGVRALYLKQAYQDDTNRVQNFTGSNLAHVNEGWDWGFQLDGSYHFGTGNDITLDWTHYSNDSSQKDLPSISIIGMNTVSISMNNQMDQVNLVLGQDVNFGVVKNIRFYGGLQYARIRTEFENKYAIPLPSQLGPQPFKSAVFTEVKGVGPVIGIDYSYDLYHGLSFTANAASSILYGNARYSSQFVLENLNLVVGGGIYASAKRVTPSLEAKLGVNYAHEAPNGTLNIAAGYQVLNYFNALHSRTLTALGPLRDTNYGLYGPYLGVKWVGNA